MKMDAFIVVDGIDGSGKSTVVRAMKDWVEQEGKRSFDFTAWCEEHGSIPELADVRDADVLFTCEPTKAWVGSAIRTEMSRQDQGYTGKELADAFSLDRLLFYRRFLLPARKAGKLIIQDRSVSSSIAYQPVMQDGPTLEELLALPGNKLAMEHAPDHLILTHVPVETALERLGARGDGRDVFETAEHLQAFQERFHADWYKELFQKQGTHVHTLDTHVPLPQSITNAAQLLASLLT